MTNELVMTDGRILRQNLAIANKLAFEWHETKHTILTRIMGEISDVTQATCCVWCRSNGDRISAWSKIKLVVNVEC